MTAAEREDHTVSGTTDEMNLPPPTSTTPSTAPIAPSMPEAANRQPVKALHADDQRLAATQAVQYAAMPKHRRSRTRVYTIGALVFVLISVAGYIGFRQYIYGDDAPPVPVLDD